MRRPFCIVFSALGLMVCFSPPAGAQRPAENTLDLDFSTPLAYPSTEFPVEIIWPQASPAQAAPSVDPSWRENYQVLLESASPSRQSQGIDGLAQLSPEEAAAQLLEALPDLQDPALSQAFEALGQLPGGGWADALLQALVKDEGTLWQTLVERLPALKGQLEPPMMQAVAEGEADAERRMAAADCLGAMGSWAAMPLLVDTAWTSGPPLSHAAVAAVVKAQAPGCAPYLIDLSGHEDPEVRRMAIEGLAVNGNPAALERLAQVMLGGEPLPELRVFAAQALGQSNARRSLEPLIQALRAEPTVAQAAYAALLAITGENIGPEPGAWLLWYKTTQQPAAPPEAAPKTPPEQPVTPPPAQPVAPPVPPGFDRSPDFEGAADGAAETE